jgi:5-methylcytosine-specific restriction endonuclease McrA
VEAWLRLLRKGLVAQAGGREVLADEHEGTFPTSKVAASPCLHPHPRLHKPSMLVLACWRCHTQQPSSWPPSAA